MPWLPCLRGACKSAWPGYSGSQPSQAFHWIREVAFHDPDHQQARKTLGFVRYKDGWGTPFTAERLKKDRRVGLVDFARGLGVT